MAGTLEDPGLIPTLALLSIFPSFFFSLQGYVHLSSKCFMSAGFSSNSWTSNE
jgi:hypothetical protein